MGYQDGTLAFLWVPHCVSTVCAANSYLAELFLGGTDMDSATSGVVLDLDAQKLEAPR